MRYRFGAALLALLAIAVPAAATPAPDPRLIEIERRTGGRLGVALMDGAGTILTGHRTDERFAMCSTFKLLLAARVLEGAAQRRWSLAAPLRFTRADLLSHSPITERHVGRGRIDMRSAASAIVTDSDNASANLLLRATGGPAGLTNWLRRGGDRVTRLDRFELALNENRRGDPRDTTTPSAMASSTRRLAVGNGLRPAGRRQLREWMAASRTGLQRIRAGLPAGWAAGDKTGTCGTAYNDVAWFRSPAGRDYVLAVYLDRPSVPAAAANAAIADVARSAVRTIAVHGSPRRPPPAHYAPQASPVY